MNKDEKYNGITLSDFTFCDKVGYTVFNLLHCQKRYLSNKVILE